MKIIRTAIVAIFTLTSGVAAHAAPFTWAGLYVGGNVGYSWGNSDTDFAMYNNTTNALLYSASGSFAMNGVIGGLQVGYNWQFTPQWLYGVEADIQATGQSGDITFFCTTPSTCSPGQTWIPAGSAGQSATLEQKLAWLGTFRGRFGLVVTPSLLAYVTGGLAFGEIKSDGSIRAYTGTGAVTISSFSGDSTKAGWTVGAGLEAHLMGQWTGKIEYLYVDLGTVDFSGVNTAALPPLRANFSSHITDNILRVGLNFHF